MNESTLLLRRRHGSPRRCGDVVVACRAGGSSIISGCVGWRLSFLMLFVRHTHNAIINWRMCEYNIIEMRVLCTRVRCCHLINCAFIETHRVCTLDTTMCPHMLVSESARAHNERPCRLQITIVPTTPPPPPSRCERHPYPSAHTRARQVPNGQFVHFT